MIRVELNADPCTEDKDAIAFMQRIHDLNLVILDREVIDDSGISYLYLYMSGEDEMMYRLLYGN